MFKMLNNLNQSGQQLLAAKDVILIFLAFIFVILLIVYIKKIYYRLRYKKRYYIFPKMGVKGIANVAMVISISIAIILLLTIITAGIMAVIFRAYPGWRVTIEGILIKVGGLLFGPIIGIFIGGITDLLAVTLTAGAFHYGYFVAAMMYGLLAGIVRTIWNYSRKNETIFALSVTIICMLILSLLIMVFYLQPSEAFVISVFAFKIELTKITLSLILSGVFLFGLVMLWTGVIIYNRGLMKYYWKMIFYSIRYKLPLSFFHLKLKMNHDKQKFADIHLKWYSEHSEKFNSSNIANKKMKTSISIKKQNNWFSYFAPVLATVLIGESIINVIFLPAFDVDFSAFPAEYWIAFRTILLVFVFVINLLVIYPVYRIVCPAMQYKYENDIIEDLSIPLVIQ